MSALHELSSVTPLPEFDLFGVPPTQLTIERDLVTEHRPISVLNSSSVIDFIIPSAVDEYIQLRETLLYMKIKINIKKTGGTDILDTDWKKIGPVNNFLHSLFRTVNLEMGGKSITLAPQTYAYKAFFESLLGYTKDAKDSFLSAVGWYNDIGEKNELKESRSLFIRPRTPIATSGEGISIELIGKLHLDLALQPRALLGGTKIKISLAPNDPAFYLWTKDDTIKPTVMFESASLFVHRSKVNFPIVDAHNLALNKGTAKYPISRGMVKAFTINSGTRDVSIDNAINGQLPRRIFVALVSNEAFTGSLTTNPFNFQHYNLNHIAAFLDGTQFPSIAYKPDFANKLYARSYMGLFEALNQITSDATLALTKTQYAYGNTIFGFNFAPDTADDCNKMGYVSPIKRGTLRLDMKFAQALSEVINVLIYCEYDNLIEIDSTRSVKTDYI